MSFQLSFRREERDTSRVNRHRLTAEAKRSCSFGLVNASESHLAYLTLIHDVHLVIRCWAAPAILSYDESLDDQRGPLDVEKNFAPARFGRRRI